MTGATNISLDAIFTNEDVEVSASYDELIGGHPAVIGFWSPEAGVTAQAITGGIGISVIPNRKPGSALVLQQAATGAMPYYLESAGPQGRAVAEFNSGGGDNMAASEADALPLGDRSWVVVFKAPPATGNTYLVWPGGTSGGYYALLLSVVDGGTRIIGRTGTAGALAEVTGNYTPNAVQVAVMTYNAEDKVLRLRMNGGAFASSPPANPVIDRTEIVIGGGALNALQVADVIITANDLSDAVNAELVGYILGYIRNSLGLPV